MKKPKGWRRESNRHRLAAKGIKTKRKPKKNFGNNIQAKKEFEKFMREETILEYGPSIKKKGTRITLEDVKDVLLKNPKLAQSTQGLTIGINELPHGQGMQDAALLRIRDGKPAAIILHSGLSKKEIEEELKHELTHLKQFKEERLQEEPKFKSWKEALEWQKKPQEKEALEAMKKNYGMASTFQIPHWLLDKLAPGEKKEAEKMLFEQGANIGIIAKKFGIKHPLQGVPRKPSVFFTREQKIDFLKNLGRELGRTPTLQDVTKNRGPTSFIEPFGSWNEALKIAGFEPTHLLKMTPTKTKIKKFGYVPTHKEIWTERRREYRQRPEMKEKEREHSKEYRQRLEVKERQKEYEQRPEVKERRREYRKEYSQRPEIKEKTRDYLKEYRQKPEVKEKTREQNKSQYWTKRFKKAGLEKEAL